MPLHIAFWSILNKQSTMGGYAFSLVLLVRAWRQCNIFCSITDKDDLIHWLWRKLIFKVEHGAIGFHTAVRWLSLRKVLKRVWEQKLKHFVRRKAIVFQISHMTNYWCALINELNSKLQDQNLICELHTLWWRLWECCNLYQTSWRAAFVLTCQ